MKGGFFRALAYALYLVAILLPGALVLWACRMVAVGGSVSTAWQMAISLGCSAWAFVTMTLVGATLCIFAATGLLNGRGKG